MVEIPLASLRDAMAVRSLKSYLKSPRFPDVVLTAIVGYSAHTVEVGEASPRSRGADPVSEGRAKPGSPATLSWMIRCWEEPRGQEEGEPVFRCFVRDLKTGEERYVSDPRELGELVLRRLRESGRTSRGAQKNYKIG